MIELEMIKLEFRLNFLQIALLDLGIKKLIP